MISARRFFPNNQNRPNQSSPPPWNPSPESPWLPPLAPGPVIPPNRPSQFGSIRFLFAAINQPPLTLFLNNDRLGSPIRYTDMTLYHRIPVGANRILVADTRRSNGVSASITLPVFQNQMSTIAIINSPFGIELMVISDMPCLHRQNKSCLRTVNLSPNSSPANLFLSRTGLIFQDVAFQTVTSYRQLNPGNYTAYITDFRTTAFPASNQLQIAISGGSFLPWIQSNLNLQRNTAYTLYLLGNANGFPTPQAILAETGI